MTHQISDNLKRITENEKKARDLGKNHLNLGYQTSPSTRLKLSLLLLDEQRGKSMVLQSAVDTRVGLLKDDCVEMDMEHRKQEDKIEKLHKQKEEEVSLESGHLIAELVVDCYPLPFRTPSLSQNSY